MIFQNSPNITHPFVARDILVNFEMSLAVFIPNTDPLETMLPGLYFLKDFFEGLIFGGAKYRREIDWAYNWREICVGNFSMCK